MRLLHVERAARGLGIGSRWWPNASTRPRPAGYRKLVLWTNESWLPRRRLYERAGFTLAGEERHHSFGKDLVGQNWRLDLRVVCQACGIGVAAEGGGMAAKSAGILVYRRRAGETEVLLVHPGGPFWARAGLRRVVDPQGRIC